MIVLNDGRVAMVGDIGNNLKIVDIASGKVIMNHTTQKLVINFDISDKPSSIISSPIVEDRSFIENF